MVGDFDILVPDLVENVGREYNRKLSVLLGSRLVVVVVGPKGTGC
jgi:hypothetical protein